LDGSLPKVRGRTAMIDTVEAGRLRRRVKKLKARVNALACRR
jgi:hypothetical protein